MNRSIFVSALRAELNKRGLTVAELAKRLGKSRASVYALLNADATRVFDGTVYSYAEALELPSDYFHIMAEAQTRVN